MHLYSLFGYIIHIVDNQSIVFVHLHNYPLYLCLFPSSVHNTLVRGHLILDDHSCVYMHYLLYIIQY